MITFIQETYQVSFAVRSKMPGDRFDYVAYNNYILAYVLVQGIEPQSLGPKPSGLPLT